MNMTYEITFTSTNKEALEYLRETAYDKVPDFGEPTVEQLDNMITIAEGGLEMTTFFDRESLADRARDEANALEGELQGDRQMQEAVDFSFEELIDEHASIRLKLKHLKEASWVLEGRIAELMALEGATERRAGDRTVKITRPVTYDYTILAQLREITDPLDLDGIYTPAHDEMKRIPEKWDMVRGRKLSRLGTDHRTLITSAKIYGNPRIEVSPKDVK